MALPLIAVDRPTVVLDQLVVSEKVLAEHILVNLLKKAPLSAWVIVKLAELAPAIILLPILLVDRNH